MKKEELISQLTEHPLFAGICQKTLSSALGVDAITEFSVGQEIYSPKSSEKKLGIILSGTASVFSTDENNGVLLRILEKGDTFGVANLFSKRESFVSIIMAKKSCRVLFFSEAAMERRKALLSLFSFSRRKKKMSMITKRTVRMAVKRGEKLA